VHLDNPSDKRPYIVSLELIRPFQLRRFFLFLDHTFFYFFFNRFALKKVTNIAQKDIRIFFFILIDLGYEENL